MGQMRVERAGGVNAGAAAQESERLGGLGGRGARRFGGRRPVGDGRAAHCETLARELVLRRRGVVCGRPCWVAGTAGRERTHPQRVGSDVFGAMRSLGTHSHACATRCAGFTRTCAHGARGWGEQAWGGEGVFGGKSLLQEGDERPSGQSQSSLGRAQEPRLPAAAAACATAEQTHNKASTPPTNKVGRPLSHARADCVPRKCMGLGGGGGVGVGGGGKGGTANEQRAQGSLGGGGGGGG
jgi:hypothetical protein